MYNLTNSNQEEEMNKKLLITIGAFVLCLFAASCSPKTGIVDGITVVTGKGQAKYVFLFVGDGMSAAQITAAQYYLSAKDNTKNNQPTYLNFTKFPVVGLSNTDDYGSIITDSASAATAFASGRKTISAMINMDPVDGTHFKTIAEYAKDAGMKVGVVSTVTLTHATPASFYGKVASRGNAEGNENEPVGLAQQLVESGFDYYGGGWITGSSASNDKYLDDARELGYTIARTPQEFNELNNSTGKVIALAERAQDSGAMHYEIDRLPSDLSIVDFTRKGIELLENPNGFFFMVESGKIDWASHANDAGAVIHDLLAFDNAIALALEFYKKYPKQTLILVTGDHETGGMSLGWADTGHSMQFDKITKQTRSHVAFNEEIVWPYKEQVSNTAQRRIEDLYSDILESFGIDLRPESLNISITQRNQIEVAFRRSMGQAVTEPLEGWSVFCGYYEPLTVKLTHVLNQSAGIGWSSYSHTALPVLSYAIGVHQEIFGGYYDNTEIFYKLASAMNMKVK